MKSSALKEMVLSLLVLLAVGIPPNLFPAAQAGIAPMPLLARWLLIPSIVILFALAVASLAFGFKRLSRRLALGATAGLVATVGLEMVRITSFRVFGAMPGSMPELLGVLLTDRMMDGPSTVSNILGWAYHFWNGACFGVIFAVVFGRKPVWWAVVYAELIGIGFLLSPAVSAMGIGFMGSQMPGMPVTVALAHLVYGTLLGVLYSKWLKEKSWLFARASPAVPAGAPSLPEN